MDSSRFSHRGFVEGVVHSNVAVPDHASQSRSFAEDLQELSHEFTAQLTQSSLPERPFSAPPIPVQDLREWRQAARSLPPMPGITPLTTAEQGTQRPEGAHGARVEAASQTACTNASS